MTLRPSRPKILTTNLPSKMRDQPSMAMPLSNPPISMSTTTTTRSRNVILRGYSGASSELPKLSTSPASCYKKLMLPPLSLLFQSLLRSVVLYHSPTRLVPQRLYVAYYGLVAPLHTYFDRTLPHHLAAALPHPLHRLNVATHPTLRSTFRADTLRRLLCRLLSRHFIYPTSLWRLQSTSMSIVPSCRIITMSMLSYLLPPPLWMT